VTVRVKMTRALARRLVESLPAVLSGATPDATGAARALALRLGLTALAFIKEAFVDKSTGRRDEAGGRWAAHAASTVKRRGPGALIGRDKGLLLSSLGPGAVSAVPGEATIASNLPYAAYFHKKRPLWPDPAHWPERWRAELARQLLEGALAVVLALLRKGP